MFSTTSTYEGVLNKVGGNLPLLRTTALHKKDSAIPTQRCLILAAGELQRCLTYEVGRWISIGFPLDSHLLPQRIQLVTTHRPRTAKGRTLGLRSSRYVRNTSMRHLDYPT